MEEMKSGLLVKTKSRIFATLDVRLVGCATNWDNENIEHKSMKSFASVENGDKDGGWVFHMILGKLKSPIKITLEVGKRV